MPLLRHSKRSSVSQMFVKRTGGVVKLEGAAKRVAGGMIAVKRHESLQRRGKYEMRSASHKRKGGAIEPPSERPQERKTTVHAGLVQTPSSNEGPRTVERKRILDSIAHHMAQNTKKIRRA